MKSFLNSRKLTFILFFVYLFILSWVIVAKMDWNLLKSSNLSWINHPRVLLHPGITWRTVNLIPYSHLDIVEVLLNILFFIPFSFYIKMLHPKSSGFSWSDYYQYYFSYLQRKIKNIYECYINTSFWIYYSWHSLSYNLIRKTIDSKIKIYRFCFYNK